MTTRQAVIDIGSNAIRLVVYAGALRAPMPIYNEKSRVALGTSLARNGMIDGETMNAALAAIGRFHRLAKAMDVENLQIIATAATREAKNGPELVSRAKAIGIQIKVIDGITEANLAGLGIISEHPGADGYVGDLGGGSLELVSMLAGKIGARISLPLGTLRINHLVDKPQKDVVAVIKSAIQSAEGAEGFPLDKGLPFFMVGGSWRALARLHIHHRKFPLAVLSNYEMPPSAPDEMLPYSKQSAYLLENKIVPSGRVEALPGATALLSGVVRLLKPTKLITSTSGVREGLLYDRLSAKEREQDPFIEAARQEGARLSRFRFHGDALADWITPLFTDEPPHQLRLLRISCLLSDIAWNVSPDYRADVAYSLALDGNWPGASTEDRAILAATLMTVHDPRKAPGDFPRLFLSAEIAQKAISWGLAIRLAFRIDGGTGSALADAKLSKGSDVLTLNLEKDALMLKSGSVERRLGQLATALGLGNAQLVSGEGS